MKQKRTHTSVRITADQYDALLKIATVQQAKKGVHITVGAILRKIVQKELTNYDGNGICVNAGKD